MQLIERAVVHVELKADHAKRRIEGYASVFGNVDGNDDIVLKGAYTRTLENDFPAGKIKVKRNHQYLIGKPVHAEQDSKGLLTVSQISETPLGNETLCLVQDGVIDEMSIGFRTEEKGYTNVDGRRIREVKAAKLFEWSFMDDRAANSAATVIGLKSLDDVLYVFSQMESALYSLRNLASIPAEVLARLGALMQDIESVSASADVSADQEQLASVSALLTELQSVLSPSARSA